MVSMSDSGLDADLAQKVRDPSPDDFRDTLRLVVDRGRPAIPDLMLVARDADAPLGRLCALMALHRLAELFVVGQFYSQASYQKAVATSRVAQTALMRIGKLGQVHPIDRMWLLAGPPYDGGPEMDHPVRWLIREYPDLADRYPPPPPSPEPRRRNRFGELIETYTIETYTDPRGYDHASDDWREQP